MSYSRFLEYLEMGRVKKVRAAAAQHGCAWQFGCGAVGVVGGRAGIASAVQVLPQRCCLNLQK